MGREAKRVSGMAKIGRTRDRRLRTYRRAAKAEGDTRVVEVPLDDILRDPQMQVRIKLDEETIKRYESIYAADNEMPPVKAALIGDALVLVDGWHRMAALERLGYATVQAEIIPASQRETFWLAAKANLEHGLPLKRREIREVFRAYIRARKHVLPGGDVKSYRDIAQDLGGLRRHTTIRYWMMKDFPKIARRMGGDDPAPGEKGGDEGGPRIGSPLTFAEVARNALQQALAAYHGILDPKERGAVLAEAEDVLYEMRAKGNWEMPLRGWDEEPECSK